MSLIASDPEVLSRPEVVTPPAVLAPAVLAPLDRFRLDPAGLKREAARLAVLPVVAVETDEAAAKLAEARAQIKTVLKDIEHRRKTIVEPVKKEAAAVDAEAKSWREPLERLDKRIESVLLAYQRLREDRRRREEEERQRQLAAAAEAQGQAEASGDAQGAEAASTELMKLEASEPLPSLSGYKTDSGTTFTRKEWKHRVVNPELVPREYLVPDDTKLRAAVRAGVREIAGVEVYEDESLPVRGRA